MDYLKDNNNKEQNKIQETEFVSNQIADSHSKDIQQSFDNEFISSYRTLSEEDYKQLHSNVVKYKNGDKDAGNDIISSFHAFIKRYVDFICLGHNGDKFTEDGVKVRIIYSKSVTKFIKMFISKEDKTLAKTQLDKDRLFAKTCIKINLIFDRFEYWEVYNELVCALLHMANKYKITQEGDKYHKKNGTFHMYVDRCFHFDAFNALKKLISDPLTGSINISLGEETTSVKFRGLPSYIKKTITSDDSIAYECGGSEHWVVIQDNRQVKEIDDIIHKADRKATLKDTTILTLKEGDNVDVYDDNSLNFNWTNGSTCSDVFKVLTPYEREILVMSLIRNMTDGEIAAIYGCHRITILKHKRIAMEKVKEEVKKSGI